MKKLLAIMATAILISGVVAVIVWACCGQGTEPIVIYNISADPMEVPCVNSAWEEVTISFTIDLRGFNWPEPGWDWGATYADVYANETMIAGGLYVGGMGGTYPMSVAWTPTEAGTYDVRVEAYNAAGTVRISESLTGQADVGSCYTVDIKGGSCPNSVNRGAKGVMPVAILGEMDELEALDPDSIKVGGVLVIPGKAIYEDSTAPNPGTGDPAICEDCFDASDPANFNCDTNGDGVNDAFCGDGMMELVVYVNMQELAAGPLAGYAIGDCVPLEVLGKDDAGNDVEVGSDSVRIVK